MAVVAEFSPYVSAILNQSSLNIGVIFLSLLYKGMFSVKIVFGPFWFLQL